MSARCPRCPGDARARRPELHADVNVEPATAHADEDPIGPRRTSRSWARHVAFPAAAVDILQVSQAVPRVRRPPVPFLGCWPNGIWSQRGPSWSRAAASGEEASSVRQTGRHRRGRHPQARAQGPPHLRRRTLRPHLAGRHVGGAPSRPRIPLGHERRWLARGVGVRCRRYGPREYGTGLGCRRLTLRRQRRGDLAAHLHLFRDGLAAPVSSSFG